jgi:uncharacterized membrane protein YiaA
MPTKVSEKKLFVAIACLVIGVVLLMKVQVIEGAIRVSEKGLLLAVLSVCLLVFGAITIKRANVKV